MKYLRFIMMLLFAAMFFFAACDDDGGDDEGAVDTVVSLSSIAGVTPPVLGGTPVTSITETDQYTGTVSWSPDDNPFAGGKTYAATITLTARAEYTFSGVAADFFSVAGAESVSNDAGSGVVTAVFPGTVSDTTPPAKIALAGISATGDSVTFTWTDPSDSDFDHLEVSYPGITATENVAAGTGTCTLTGLSPSTLYTVSAISVDTAGNSSEAKVFCVKTPASGSLAFTAISTAAELDDVCDNLAGHYLLTADLDLSSYASWTPIGSDTSHFTGVLNGNGHRVSNLTITSGGDYAGLFGYIDGGAVSDLRLMNVNVSGARCIGGLAGYIDRSEMINCYTTGTVSGTDFCVGGLVGQACTSSTITNCYATGAVSGLACVGGLVGDLYQSTITNCYATGDVTGTENVGGLVGGSEENTINDSYATGAISGSHNTGGLAGAVIDSTITNSYATGDVNCDDDTGGLVGGAIGANTITSCYATGAVSGTTDVGGILGLNYEDSSTITDSFYDTDTTGMSDTGKGIGISTTEMKTGSTFIDAGWDFAGETVNGTADIWSIDSSINSGYPYLTGLGGSY